MLSFCLLVRTICDVNIKILINWARELKVVGLDTGSLVVLSKVVFITIDVTILILTTFVVLVTGL